MYAPIYKVSVGSIIEYLGNKSVVVKQLGKRNGTNCCCLENNHIIEFAEEGASSEELKFDNQQRMRKNYWYYSYKAMVKVISVHQ